MTILLPPGIKGLKAGYIADKKRASLFCVNKNFCVKDVINKINGEKEKRIACTKYFFLMFLKHVTMHYRSGRTVREGCY